MAAWVFAGLVVFISTGVLWFRVVQPIMDAWKPPVKPYQPAPKRKRVRYVVVRRARSTQPAARSTPLRTDTQRAEIDEAAKNSEAESTPEVAISARLEKRELITLLAVQKNADGGYTYSANKIRDFVGGTASEVYALIREIRGEDKAATPEPKTHAKGARLERPAEGWAA